MSQAFFRAASGLPFFLLFPKFPLYLIEKRLLCIPLWSKPSPVLRCSKSTPMSKEETISTI